MFFEVRIFDADGDLKRVVSPKKLSKKYWKESNNTLPDYSDYDLSPENLESQKTWGEARLQVDDTNI